MTITLRNPHSVLAILATRPEEVLSIRVAEGSLGEGWRNVVALAHRSGIQVERGRGQPTSGGRGRPRPQDAERSERSGGGEAVCRERSEVTLEELFAGQDQPSASVSGVKSIKSSPATVTPQFEATRDSSSAAALKGPHGLWLALDCLQDPHNVGAIFRSAAFYGVRGIVVTRDRSAPLTSVVYDVAAGGIEYVPFSQPTNLSRALEVAKKAGLWILGSSEHAEKDIDRIPHDRSWLLVIGNEEKGIRRLTQEHCDELCRINARGQVTSLNASVAAAVMISKLSG